jgi:hypothetical protein
LKPKEEGSVMGCIFGKEFEGVKCFSIDGEEIYRTYHTPEDLLSAVLEQTFEKNKTAFLSAVAKALGALYEEWEGETGNIWRQLTLMSKPAPQEDDITTDDLRKSAKCIFVSVDEPVARDVAKKLEWAANKIDELTRPAPHSPCLRRKRA